MFTKTQNWSHKLGYRVDRQEEENMANILIVDDDDFLRSILTEYLEGQGYDCTPAENVEQARSRLNERRFQLAISDFNMPSESGLDLLKHLSSRCPATSFILMSGDVNPGLRDRAFELGASACVAKPFKLQDLLKKVRNALISESQTQLQ
jgi:DNA-binding NtrC family response regulator